ncbi:hypothetical protein BU17DRAFT_87243 [Hysterangium stoloniferum]|nr:hypothetical protein BU17DRAFT_87243 [Hysterangium stoloniferum]
MANGNPTADQNTTKSSQTLPDRKAPSPSSFIYYTPHDQALSTARRDGIESPDATMPVYAYGSTLPSPSSSAQPKPALANDVSGPAVWTLVLTANARSERKGSSVALTRSAMANASVKIMLCLVAINPYLGLGAGDAENNGSTQATHGVPLPYVGPIGYPPGIWGAYSPAGPGGKLEGAGFYQPVFAFTPVGGQPHYGGQGGSASGGSETPHFPVGFFPATFISYPGPFQPYPVPQGPGAAAHGFHFAYPPPAMSTGHHLPPATTTATNPGSSVDAHAKNPVDNVVEGSGKGEKSSCSQVNGQGKVAEPQANVPAEKEKKAD